MARTVLPLQTIAGFGAGLDTVTWTSGDAANDHQFDNTSGQVLLLCRNTDGSPHTADVMGVADPYGRTANKTITVPAGGYSVYGPFPTTLFNQTGQLVYVDGVTLTGTSFAAIKITK